MNCTVGLAKLLFTEREENFKLFRVDFKTPRGVQRVEQIEPRSWSEWRLDVVTDVSRPGVHTFYLTDG